ncbi:hypothetical protein D9757_012414 [Collybiopsis confluens]|uniref:Uncharacterized protein n=1 Tax=Collybiopsis confluens TaxID=2823264 RepID=A0A8H5H0F0_9AGAR|nr:hypothetical protein D9757_014215 [Collybiopsis confluens]KAF5374554.1 hypothetical protein D9757_012414 [Collybiopsis confluens]
MIDFDNMLQAHLITVWTTKFHSWFEEFPWKGWSEALMVRQEQAWDYTGTYQKTGYERYEQLSAEEFEVSFKT